MDTDKPIFTNRPFEGQVHQAYTLAIISLLDIMMPEAQVLEVVSNLAENIYEEVITKSGFERVEKDPRIFGGGSGADSAPDGPPEND